MPKVLETCKNCEQKFKKKFKFCPHCGQKVNDALTLGVLFYNTISNYFSFDARFFKSFIPLLFKPGYLASKFIEGKRLLYLHPAQMYLFITVVFFFLFSFIQRDQVQSLDKQLAKSLPKAKVLDTISNANVRDSLQAVALFKEQKEDSITRSELEKPLNDNRFLTGMPGAKIDSLVNADDYKKNGIQPFDFNQKELDSLITLNVSDDLLYNAMGMRTDANWFSKRLYAQALKFYKSRQGGSILQVFYDAVPIAMFFLLPIFAVLLKLFYRKRGTYAHHLVFSFYYFSFLFVVFSVIIGVNFILDIPDWIDLLIAISSFGYLLIALQRFYQQGVFKSFIKGSVVSFLFLAFVAPLTVFFLGVFAFLSY
ncbi:DUF3667 domain-containing protein [Thalassobellus sediminis]|uniref:DUF3667 domain-containing protein n=1 Tax=Thalassobellus sediminis TaxID=3367753 RepID=UPI0037A5C8FE